jgi:integrase
MEVKMSITERRLKSGKSYRVEVTLHDGKRITKTFTKKSHAKTWDSRMKVETQIKEALGISNVKDDTFFSDYIKSWLKTVENTKAKNTYKNYESHMRVHITPLLSGKRMKEVGWADAEELVNRLKITNHKNRGINTILITFQAALNFAVKAKYLAFNPLSGFPKLKVQAKVSYWSELEVRRFLKANASSYCYDLCVGVLNSGMRRGEAGGLLWDKVFFDTNMIRVARCLSVDGLEDIVKTHHSYRLIPMSPEFRSLLLKLKNKRKSEFVFTGPDGTGSVSINHVHRIFKRAQGRATMDSHVTFHSMRDTFASHFMMRGGSIYDLQKILGHANLTQTQKYAHLSPEYLAGTTERIGFTEDYFSDSI